MNKVLFFFLLSILVNPIYAQENDLFFIVAHPFYDAEPFPSYLFKLNHATKSLDTIQQLSTDKEALREVKYYPEYRKIIILKDGWFRSQNTRNEVKIVDMDVPYKSVNINLDSLNYRYLYSWLFNIKDNEKYFCIQLSNPILNESDFLFGIEIDKLKIKKLDLEGFTSAHLSGNTGSCLLTLDGLPAITNLTDGTLRIPKVNDISKRPVFSIQLPKEFQLGKKERRSIVINTSDMFVFSISNSHTNEKNIGSSELAILDKKSNLWFRHQLKGNCDYMMRSFDKWLAGTVYSNNKIFDEKGRLTGSIQRVSPGKEKRRKKATKTGMPIDYRFDYFGVYSPGILYLLNSETRNYIEWSTGQGDSEILLVERNIVYYRVSDEIYKADIQGGKKLGKIQLVLKSELVPDIHWGFLLK